MNNASLKIKYVWKTETILNNRNRFGPHLLVLFSDRTTVNMRSKPNISAQI